MFEYSRLTKEQKKVFLMNAFLPGLGFFYSKKIIYGLIFGLIPVLMIATGVITVFTHPVITFILWSIGLILHLICLYLSTKVEVEEKSNLFLALYLVLVLSYITYCVIMFFINVMEIARKFYG